jgi:hypothetical protein
VRADPATACVEAIELQQARTSPTLHRVAVFATFEAICAA